MKLISNQFSFEGVLYVYLINDIDIQKEWCCCTFGSRNLSKNIGAQSSSNNISSNQFEILATKWKSIESISKYEKQENSDYDYNIKISLTDEVKSDDHLDDQVRSVSNRRVANKSSSIFKFRSDVVLKTIFRSFRKYFIKDFKRYYNFIYAKNKPQLFVSKVREYLIKRFGYENEEMRTIFICIIDTKQKYFQIRDDQEQILTMINSLMYNFNNDKMMELVDWAEFAKMLKAFFLD